MKGIHCPLPRLRPRQQDIQSRKNKSSAVEAERRNAEKEREREGDTLLGRKLRRGMSPSSSSLAARIYIYMYSYMCVSMCVCVYTRNGTSRPRWRVVGIYVRALSTRHSGDARKNAHALGPRAAAVAHSTAKGTNYLLAARTTILYLMRRYACSVKTFLHSGGLLMLYS